MLDFYVLLELAELRAIHAALSPDANFAYRARCRQYSTLFHTPLHVVYDLDPLFVFQSLQEEKYTYRETHDDLEGILELLYRIRDPQYVTVSQQDTEDLVDAVLNKEIERAARKKTPIQETYSSLPEQKPAPKAKPKSGSMSFGDLEKADEKTESRKGNF